MNTKEKFNHPSDGDECPICGDCPANMEMDCGKPKGICPRK